jgi:hypothetical protein
MAGKRAGKRGGAKGAEEPVPPVGKRGRTRWLLRVAVLLAAGLVGLLWVVRRQSENRLTVENRSSQAIAYLQVTVAGKASTFRDVPPGAEVAVPLGGKAEDQFAVEGQLADGTRIRGRGVAGERATLVVLPGGQTEFRPGGKGSGP